MRKYVPIYEDWKMVKPALGYVASKKLGFHVRQATDSQEEGIYMVVLKLTEKSTKDILEIIKEFFQAEYENWSHEAKYILLYNGDIPNNQQYLKGREINCELDGLCKTEFGIYGRIKGFSFVGFAPNICILKSKEGKDEFETVKNLNYKNINNVKLSGYITTFD